MAGDEYRDVSLSPCRRYLVKVGEKLQDVERTLGQRQLIAYASATWDWHRLHYDSEFARSAGMRAPVVDGQMLGALLAEHALMSVGHRAQIKRVHFRNRAPVYAGDTVRLQGRVVALEAGIFTIEQEVMVGDEVVVSPAGSEILLDP